MENVKDDAIVVYSLDNHNGKDYVEFDLDGKDERRFPNLNEYKWPGGGSVNDNISSMKVGKDVYVKLYEDADLRGRYEAYWPNDWPTRVWLSNNVSSIMLKRK